jgi:hypothetical protein
LLSEGELDTYYPEFLVDGLLRADIRARWDSYMRAIQNGVLSPNEVRDLENRNPREGGDDFWKPANMDATGADANPEADGEDETKSFSDLFQKMNGRNGSHA